MAALESVAADVIPDLPEQVAKETVADRISDLPEDVLHHILSFLPIKHAARTSVLSKRWSSVWNTLPYLNFCQGFFDEFFKPSKRRLMSRQMRKYMILQRVAESLILRRSEQNGCILKLSYTIPQYQWFCGPRFELENQNPILERLISSVARSSLRELMLITDIHRCGYDCLPSNILSAKSLNVLSLEGFNLMSFSSLDIKLPSLRRLDLLSVNLDDHILGNLIVGCPSLNRLELLCCSEIRTICVTGLPELKFFRVDCMPHVKILEIDAPELLDLFVIFPSGECRFNLKTCPRLRKLTLLGEFITGKLFRHLVSQCLSLEFLQIQCNQMENIKISSDTLKTLILKELEKLVEVEITAPALEKLCFGVQSLPTFLLDASDMLEVVLVFSGDFGHDEVTKFLGYFSHFRTVTLRGLVEGIIIPKDKRDNLLPPLCGTRNLVVDLQRPKFVPKELVEYLLWLSPRAQSVSIKEELPVNNRGRGVQAQAFIKFIYDQKNDYRDWSSPCCKFLPIMCWRHCLAEVRVLKFHRDENEMTEMKNFFLRTVKNLKFVSSVSLSFFDGLYNAYDELFL